MSGTIRATHTLLVSRTSRVLLPALLILLFAPILPAEAKSDGNYLYNLASFTGTIPSLWARVALDAETGEVYSLNRHVSSVQIFNPSAMLIHSFGEDYHLAGAIDIAVGRDGDLYVLQGGTAEPPLLHLDYRGERLGTVDLRDLPDSAPFRPTRLEFRNDKLYLLDATALRLVVLSAEGEFLKSYRIRELLTELAGGDEKFQKDVAEMDFNGFCVDARGSMYFTAPAAFSAYRLDPDGTLRGFGRSGSGPGRFGVVAGIAADSRGNIYVTDRLRSVVMIFDRDFRFVREFGFRGAGSQNLIAPDDIAIDEPNGKLYVAQAANRGVSVFRLDN